MNRLAEASSVYLRAAAHQPVDWHPWGEAAFAAARAANRLILLDIGASWCHWCHVMDHESYEDPALADFLNRHFVCVKVDRDERPDVDARYQRAVQLLTGQGGWPLTAVLDAEGEVLFGGTYFPPEDRWGRPSLRSVLERVLALWRDRRETLRAQGTALRRAIAAGGGTTGRGAVVGPGVVLAAERRMAAAYDAAYGGFGTEPKFPHPTALRFLLRRWSDGASVRCRTMVLETLHAMARGGIHDQVGGGFHRYSVDRRWIIPHFEKLAPDNAELLSAYVEAAAALDDAECRVVAGGIVGWMRDVLAGAQAGYGASQDADRWAGDDGGYYTWTREEIAAVVDEPALDLVLRHFGVGTAGAMPHDPSRHVLFVAHTAGELAAATGADPAVVEAALTQARAALRAARALRPAPAVDPTRYTSWNAMVCAALLRAAPVLGDRWAATHALATLTSLAGGDPQRPGSLPERLPASLAHAPTGPSGLLEDQVHAAEAAIEAFEETGDPRWLDWAVALMDEVWQRYREVEEGGLLDRCPDDAGGGLLDARLKPIEDSPAPSPNGIAALVCARLAAHTGGERWRERHRLLVEEFGETAPALGLHAATWLLAADWLLRPPAYLVVTGAADDPVAVALHRVARASWMPRRVVRRLLPDMDPTGLPAELRSAVRGPAPQGFVCLGTRCLLPASDPEEFSARLRQAVAGRAE
jgi:uncharacterized protein YyaL (SSP411 family)